MPRDIRHGRNMPSARRDLGKLLRQFFHRMMLSVEVQRRSGHPINWAYYQNLLAQKAAPILELYYTHGMRELVKEVKETRKLGPRRVRMLNRPVERKQKSFAVHNRIKDFVQTISVPPSPSGQYSAFSTFAPQIAQLPTFEASFNVFNIQVEQQIQTMAMQFATSTIQSVQKSVVDAYADVRQQLAEGLPKGETQREITARMQQIFVNPDKAYQIATTEASRSLHAGFNQAAEESSAVEGLEWLASFNACPECLKLDGKVVELGQPFAILPKAKPPYNVVYHPTLHPSCNCTTTVILKGNE